MRPARDARDLEQRLLAFYGVGPVTANIFLRELRPFWSKADPDPLPMVNKLARHMSIDLSRYQRKSLTFARVEAGLIRRRHDSPPNRFAAWRVETPPGHTSGADS
jgi:hypothetical protein